MIFDWIDNCRKIITTKHFPNNDGQEKKSMLQQHLILFRYLEEQDKKSKAEIKNFWLTTDSIYLTTIPEDSKEKWIDIQFNKLWKLRTKNAINFVEGQMVYNFPIYQEEIDYINSLKCDTWLRKALLLMLVCAKHNKNGILKYNNTTTAWIEEMIDPKYKVRNKMLKIGNVNAKYKLFKFVSFGSKVNKIKINFMKDKGIEAAIVYSPNYARDILELIQPYTITCEKCGKQFEPSSKNKINLCPECYIKQRNQCKQLTDQRDKHDINLIHHAPRLKGDRAQQIVKVCSCCKKEFTTTGNSKRDLCDDCYKELRKKKEKERLHQSYLLKNSRRSLGGRTGKCNYPLSDKGEK